MILNTRSQLAMCENEVDRLKEDIEQLEAGYRRKLNRFAQMLTMSESEREHLKHELMKADRAIEFATTCLGKEQKKVKELMGEPCSICGNQPSVLIDKGHKETYWKCHDCIREDILHAIEGSKP